MAPRKLAGTHSPPKNSFFHRLTHPLNLHASPTGRTLFHPNFPNHSISIMPKSGSGSGKGSSMDTAAAARIQSAEARASGGGVKSGGFASRAQAAAAQNQGAGAGKSGK